MVAVILVSPHSLDVGVTSQMIRKSRALEKRLASEWKGYRPGSSLTPFLFDVWAVEHNLATIPELSGDGIGALLRFSFETWLRVRRIEAGAKFSCGDYDSCIYLFVKPVANAKRKALEGLSQAGGKIGFVEVELDSTMVDFALFVATHELFHTLGATDKYDKRGRARYPEGFVEPKRRPLFPQRMAEVMARNLPLDTNNERPIEGLDELGVGMQTAREIGWVND